ncbi:MAG: nucleotidyltransferase family protein, partial [Clostridiales bacterium]
MKEKIIMKKEADIYFPTKNSIPSCRKLAAIVLAAGASTRMGRQKLLLPFGKSNVLNSTLTNLKKSGMKKIILVLGADYQEILTAIDQSYLQILINHNYQKGQSTSVLLGISALPADYGAMFVLGDQPLISPRIYQDLGKLYFHSKNCIVMPINEKGQRGNPVLFAPSMIEKMKELQGDKGPRKLIEEYQQDILTYTTAEAAIFMDIDTPEAYKNCL